MNKEELNKYYNKVIPMSLDDDEIPIYQVEYPTTSQHGLVTRW